MFDIEPITSRYFNLIRAQKHQGSPCRPLPLPRKKIKCPDFCDKNIKKKNIEEKKFPRINIKENMDDLDCPWCR